DLVGARSACTGRTPRTRTFLEKLESFQPRIAEAREAWERIPIRLFGSEQEQVHALTMAVRDGFFRHLVVHSAGDATVDSLLSLGTVEGQNVESYRPILLAWISALSEGGARHPEAVTGPSVVAEPRAQEHVGSPESGDPGESPHLANLARLATESCTVESAGSERKLADLRALAWGQYADALRVNGRLREANEALASADRWCENGTRDPVLRARLLLQSASLRTAEGRFSEAIDLAEDAAGVFREIGWTQATARALVQKAIACHHSGMPEEAIAVLNRAIPLIEPEPDPQLLLAACHNLVQSYIALGRQEQALSLYFEIRDLYKEFGNDLILIRVGWQEGQLLRDLGHLHAAEAALLRARKGFMERNLMLEVAHVSLDLAWVYVKLGSLDMLKQTVAEAVPIFVALRANREALAALLQLQHEKGEQMFELLRALSNWLSPSSSVLRPIEVQLDFDGMDVSRRRGD
ncbi:MAG: tetratricopeptide repeat protein, partial [Thermoanaerobaculia bacterium]